MITDETKAEHRARWFVYTGERSLDGTLELIPHVSTMRGFWPGYEVKCSCGWESKTGGGTKGYVTELLWEHRYDAQTEGER